MSAPTSDLETKKPRPGGPRLWAFRIVRAALLGYLAVCVIVYSIQNKFVFPGASATQGQKDSAIASEYYEKKLVPLHTADGTIITALFGTALQHNGKPVADNSHCPTIIYFYGNGACMAYSTGVFEHFRRLGANVIVADYEGYGMSDGKPSEKGCYATADAEYKYLRGRPDIDPKFIIPIGWSLGGAVAIDLAHRQPVAGLVTLSAFTSLDDMAKLFARWLPMSWIMKYRFDNIDKVAEISCPYLNIHGTEDELVPFYMSGELVKAASGHVTKFNVDDGEHNNIFEVGGFELLAHIDEFIESVRPAQTPPATQPAAVK